MKSIKSHICTILSGVMIFGCSGFLDEDNKSQTTVEDYYLTLDGYNGLVNSAYSNLRDVFNETPYIFCAGTDLFFAAHQDVPRGLASYQTLNPSIGEVENLFQQSYQAIQIANLALEYADKTEVFNELESRRGEMKVLRAFFHFTLLQHFGDITIVDQSINSPVVHFERAPASEAYEFIISELEDAIESLPDTQSDFGRVTKRAAQHLLAKVYLTRGYESFGTASDYTTAASLADAAIGGYDLNTVSFMDLFAFENDNNAEVLWSIQYSSGSTVGYGINEGGAHDWDSPWGPLIQSPEDGVNKKNMLHPTERLFELFNHDDNDVRFKGSFMTERTSRYYEWLTTSGGGMVSQYFPLSAADIADTANWRAADPENRADAVIYPMEASWWDGLNQQSFPSLRKFDVITNFDNGDFAPHDIYLARLGETYLIAAEAYLQAGDAGNALARVNSVRQRAGAADATSVDLDLILDERARELVGEGHRWTDLKRTGKLMEYTKIHNPDIKALVDGGSDPFMGANGNFKILRPIPESAIALDNGDYPQNPAYQ